MKNYPFRHKTALPKNKCSLIFIISYIVYFVKYISL